MKKQSKYKTVNIKAGTHRKLAIHAARTGQPIVGLLETAIEEYLDRKKKTKSAQKATA
jgi:hypothetical protein